MTSGPAPGGGLRAAGLAASALCWREILRFLRQRSRLVGALVQPLLFWLLLGAGLKASFTPAGAAAGSGYAAWVYPGIIALTLLFTAVFSTISVVEDRRSGFLQGVVVAPVPRWSLVAGQAAGSTVLGMIQGTLVLMLAPAAGLRPGAAAALSSLGVMALMAFAMSGLGLLLAWRMESTQGFHAIMNLALLPMWLLSGAFFPAEGAPSWLAWTMAANPMTYAMAALRRALALGGGAPAAGLPGMAVSLSVLTAFAATAFTLAVLAARRAAR